MKARQTCLGFGVRTDISRGDIPAPFTPEFAEGMRRPGVRGPVAPCPECGFDCEMERERGTIRFWWLPDTNEEFVVDVTRCSVFDRSEDAVALFPGCRTALLLSLEHPDAARAQEALLAAITPEAMAAYRARRCTPPSARCPADSAHDVSEQHFDMKSAGKCRRPAPEPLRMDSMDS